MMNTHISKLGLIGLPIVAYLGYISTHSSATSLHAPMAKRSLVRRDDIDTLDPLTIDLSTDNPDAIQAAYVPDPLPSDTISALQDAASLSIEYADNGVTVDDSGATIGNDSGVDDTVYTQIPDLTGKYLLYAAPDGTFRLSTSGAQAGGLQFTYSDGAAGADDQNRIMFYYPDTMTKYGVSRFRIQDYSHIPIGAQAITLLATDLGNGDAHPTFLAADTSGNVYSMLTCTYADGITPTRVFLASDPYAGAAQLQDPSMQSIVTGAPIEACAYVQFVDINPAASG